MDTGEWNYKSTCSEVWYDELIPKVKYRFILPYWHKELSKQYELTNPEIKVTALSVGIQKLENEKDLQDKESCILSIWRSFFDKWEKAKKYNLEEHMPIEIELIKSSKRKWHIIKVTGIGQVM